MATININNKSFTGKNIVVSNNRIIIDGQDVTPDAKNIGITVQGDIDKLSVDACQSVEVTGNVKNVSTMSGSVKCGDVTGDVETQSGSVECKNVGGDVETMSGSVTCGNINGDVETMTGNIKHTK